MATYEAECQRKEEVVQQLRDEIQDLHAKARATDTTLRAASEVPNDAEVTQKLLQLENEVKLRKTEVDSLKEQVTVNAQLIE